MLYFAAVNLFVAQVIARGLQQAQATKPQSDKDTEGLTRLGDFGFFMSARLTSLEKIQICNHSTRCGIPIVANPSNGAFVAQRRVVTMGHLRTILEPVLEHVTISGYGMKCPVALASKSPFYSRTAIPRLRRKWDIGWYIKTAGIPLFRLKE